MQQVAVLDHEAANLEMARQVLPEGFDLTIEEDFIQAGALIVENIRFYTVALGELLAWKMYHEGAVSDSDRERVFARYAHEWDVSRSTLVKAWVRVAKFPDLDIPEAGALNNTKLYEIISGSDTVEEAEAGIRAALANDLSTQKIREAKQLQREGLNEHGEWSVPYLFLRDGDIWGRSSDGHEVLVMRAENRDDPLARRAHAVIRRRLHV